MKCFWSGCKLFSTSFTFPSLFLRSFSVFVFLRWPNFSPLIPSPFLCNFLNVCLPFITLALLCWSFSEREMKKLFSIHPRLSFEPERGERDRHFHVQKFEIRWNDGKREHFVNSSHKSQQILKTSQNFWKEGRWRVSCLEHLSLKFTFFTFSTFVKNFFTEEGRGWEVRGSRSNFNLQPAIKIWTRSSRAKNYFPTSAPLSNSLLSVNLCESISGPWSENECCVHLDTRHGHNERERYILGGVANVHFESRTNKPLSLVPSSPSSLVPSSPSRSFLLEEPAQWGLFVRDSKCTFATPPSMYLSERQGRKEVEEVVRM